MTSHEEYDRKTRRCPKLGHDVTFGYCRAPGQETPCGTIFDCWWENFNVEEFIREHYDERTIAGIIAPPASKVTSLVELIRQAQQRNRRE